MIRIGKPLKNWKAENCKNGNIKNARLKIYSYALSWKFTPSVEKT